MKAQKKSRGFTLLEVMVAVAILALLTSAVFSSISGRVGQLDRMKSKLMAHWVAKNKIVELQLYQKWPNTGTNTSQAEMGGQEWEVKTIASEGPFPETRKVEVQVMKPVSDFTEDKSVAASLVTILANPKAHE